MNEEKYVIHCLKIWAKNFLIQSKSENVISDKYQRRHYKQKEQNTSMAVNCVESCDSDDDYTPPKQNIDETIIYLVHLLTITHRKPTHIAFYARNLVTSLSTLHSMHHFLHFFTMKL